MRLTHSIIVMFFLTIIIQYYIMSAIMVDKLNNITNSLGKLYISIIMGIFMILIMFFMHDHQFNILSTKYYIIYGIILLLFIYLYRTQAYIGDKQYLEGMIEHHSMALLTSKDIERKTNNYEVAKLAKIIIQTQQDEIDTMKNILKRIKLN